MADDPTPPATEEKPAPRPRATRTPKPEAAAKPTPARRGRPPKSAIAKTEEAVAAAVKKPAAAATSAAKSAVKAVKPRSSKRATPRAATAKKADGKKTGGWGKTAIAGGLAVVGAAATAAVFALRGSTPKPTGKGAHQADGADSSKSFEAGIADEGTIPEA